MIAPSNLSNVAKRSGNEHSDRNALGKRLKFSSARYEEFKPGALIKMRLENFVTYKMTEFDLSPSLNMIIGPNGSGKSTFVCAVCLGLAGKPELIGRSKKATDFIKNGEESGLIEITLKNSGDLQNIPQVSAGDQVIKITRRLSRLKVKTEYFINDRDATEPAVRSLVADLNIQLDNLCQFLSQERVASFAALKSEKLLVETLRSIDLSLCDMFSSLKTHQAEENSCQKELNSKQKRLDELLKKREELQGSVQQLRNYQDKKKEIELHKKLMPYVRIKALAAERKRRKAELQQAVKNLKEFLSEKSPLTALDVEVKERLASAMKQSKNNDRLFERLKAECKEKAERLRDIRNLMVKRKSKAEACRKRADRLHAELAEKRRELEHERAKLDTAQVPDPEIFSQLDSQQNELIGQESIIKRMIREAESKISTKSYEINDLKRQIITRESSLSKNDRIDVLDKLASTDRGGGNVFRIVKDAVRYVRDNPEMQKFVLEPPAIAVSVSNPRYAAYLAQCVDFNTRIAFTLIGSEAYDKFGNDLLDRFRVNTRELSATDLKPSLPKEQLRRLGFDFYLSDIVTGDADVIKMLCQNCNIHSIPISLRELNPQQITKLMEPRSNGKLLFTKFIHGDRVVDMGRGAYSRQVWTKDYECTKKTDFFQISVMTDEQRSSIKSEIAEFSTRIGVLSKEIEELEVTKRESKGKLYDSSKESERIARKLNELNDIRRAYSARDATIRSLSSEITSLVNEIENGLPSQIRRIKDEIAAAKDSQITMMRDLTRTISQLKECQETLLQANIKFFEARNLDFSMSDVIGSMNQREKELVDERNDKRRRYDEAKSLSNEEYKKKIASYSEQTQEQLHAYAERYDNEGMFNLEFIEETIDKLESEIATLNNDESAISILDQVEREIKDLKRDLPRFAGSLKETQGRIREIQKSFEPRVDDIVGKVSDKFSELFKQIGSKGHVGLSKPNAFADWKIEIKVAFRDSAELTKLDAQKQSGGERAVSTVLYMIALQPFTTAPFRVVDEINQGMDARNERIVHKFMVTNACVGNTSQYFLITPKLLTDLYYDERMMIHCVMAGPWLPNPIERPEMASFGKTSKYIL